MPNKSVIGLAGFGMEGRAAYDFFKGKAEIHIFDEKPVALTGIDATFHEGLTIPSFVPVVYKTPGIPASKIQLESPDTKITTLADLVLERVRDRAVGVTGTKGKSTVASLIAHILREAGKNPVLFGNIGVADMQLVTEGGDRPFVLELSSYQCEYLTRSPHIAVLTNFYPEHLTHHGSLDRYREAKLNLARFQTAEDVFINASDIETNFQGKLIRPTLPAAPFETQLLGAHNQGNCAIAVAAVAPLGVSEEEARVHIKSFAPLPYRIENVGTVNEITFFDDSLASIPQATLATIAALGNVDTLILGGQDRGIPFESFARALAGTSIKTFISFPDTGAKMTTEVQDRTVIPVRSMQEAVAAAFAHTPAGGTVLLSTASPSFNLFKDYKDRSAQYRAEIEAQGKG